MQQKIIEEIAKHLGVTAQDIDLSASLAEDLGLGPIEVADLLGSLASTFNINFEPGETEGITTVNDITVLIEDKSLE